jgi:hypothetical protein
MLSPKLLLGLALGVGAVGGTAYFGTQRPPLSYRGAITDFDNYILAIAADLETLHRGRQARDPDLESARAIALELHRARVTPRDSGWLLDAGVWRDHPEHRYAGRMAAPVADAPPARVVDGATDASHFSRWPLFLQSFASSWPAAGPERRYYDDLRRGLSWQFRHRVLVRPDSAFRGWRTTNFMDGRNGVYRWDYQSHRGNGYLPYQLSGTLLLGWWGFLGDSAVAAAYADMHERFPYGEAEAATYAGPWRIQPRLTDGRYQLLTLLASRLETEQGPAGSVAREIDSLWRSWGVARLREPLWRGSAAESAPYDLMVPLHFAFRPGGAALQAPFAAHFAAFAAADPMPEGATLFQRLHYMYFATRFMVLATEAGRAELIPPGLEAQIMDEWRKQWLGRSDVISQTGWGEPAFRAFKQYLEWKISHRRGA